MNWFVLAAAAACVVASIITRWLVRHIAMSGLVAELGVVFVLAARSTAPLWVRWAPPMVLSLKG
jgi:hypothetical protein